MNCPHCSAEMVGYYVEVRRTHWECRRCEISGPCEVLEALAARLAKLAHQVEFWSVCCRDAERTGRDALNEVERLKEGKP